MNVLPLNSPSRKLCISVLAFSILYPLTLKLAVAAGECDKSFPDHISEVQCINQLNKKLDEELNQAYQAALAKRPEKDAWDSRKEREQLRKSQRAWLKLKEENCTLIGGLQGGNNLWVSEFIAQCVQEETIARTKFLRRIANDAFGG
ncbi:lysozyme inhibitor LprI family protein [Duganella qianjiadongensis]|uniref:DUF1311 domain-containing protein n=1 Tax=Duganella qianjiadongensis TaxID=2692176 RepID=A0ABW9VQL0_9BURK|nr:lysozyme inhibitor LprI family protein [Duganella qianjiadongensis]MYM41461.1 DUF1311 domain-containing protein [Duganella qianjiadongensis]